MPTLLTELQRQWPRLVVAALSLHPLFYSIRGALRVQTPPPAMTPDDYHYFVFVYAFIVVPSIVDLHRLYVAYRPTTGGAQLSFKIWSIRTAFIALVYIIAGSYMYFVPEFENLVNNATFAAEVSEILSQHNQSLPVLLPEQATQSMTSPTLVETVWKGIESWMPSVLNIVLGFALSTILNQRRQLDHEQEVRQEKQGHHLLAASSDLPAPIASASTVEGFKTEAEIRRLRLRVPTWPRFIVGVWFLVAAFDGISGYLASFQSVWANLEMSFYILQSLAGLYILYRKSLVLTQRLFYSICVTTLHMCTVFGTKIWNVNQTDIELPMKTFGVGEMATINELKFFRGMVFVIVHVFFAVRLWVAWRLVADLKARDARVARAREQQELRERGLAEKQTAF